jgi:hypothetical protein
MITFGILFCIAEIIIVLTGKTLEYSKVNINSTLFI